MRAMSGLEPARRCPGNARGRRVPEIERFVWTDPGEGCARSRVRVGPICGVRVGVLPRMWLTVGRVRKPALPPASEKGPKGP